MFQAIRKDRKEKSGSELTSYFWLSGVSEHLMMFLKVPQLSAVTVQVATSDLASICYTCQTDQRDVLTIIQIDE